MFSKIALLLAVLGLSLAINDKKYKILTCEKAKIKEGVKWDWKGEGKTMYTPMWNKLDRIRTAAVLLDKSVEDLDEEDLEGNSCITYDKDNTIYGFGAETKSYKITEYNDDGFDFKFGEFEATFHLMASDGKTYFLGYYCYDDGYASWALSATTPEVSEEIEDMVMDHIKRVGFDPKNVVNESYEGCDLDEKKKKKKK